MKNSFNCLLKLILILNLVFLTNFIKAECIINITDGFLGSFTVPHTYQNCTINVSTRLSLRGKITFIDCIFNMGSNAEINMHKKVPFPIIRSNIVLFDHCVLSGSSKWTGINVASGSYLSIINSSIIANALIGINGAYQSNIRMLDSQIASNCSLGINFPNIDNRFNSGIIPTINLSEFSGNTINAGKGIKVRGIMKLDIGLNASNYNTFNGGSPSILIENSHTNIYNCRFLNGFYHIDIFNNLPDRPQNYRVCKIVGLGQNSINTFYNAALNSIRLNGNWLFVDISNARFENPPPIRSIDIDNYNNGGFSIIHNTFKVKHENPQTGAFIHARNSTIGYSRISNNTFLDPYSGTQHFSFQLVKLKPSKLDIHNNKVYGSDMLDSGQNKIGENPSPKTFCSFHAENCDNINFVGNSLRFINNSGISRWSMHHMNGKSCNFESNTVTNENFTSNRQSIRLEGSVESDVLRNNTVQNSHIGILCEHNSPNTKIQCNKIIGNGPVLNNQIGLMINGTIPRQVHEGNKWDGGNFLHEAFLNTGLAVSFLQNTFVSRDDNYNLSEKYWPTKVNRTDWFLDDKTVTSPKNCPNLNNPIPPSCSEIDENKYLSDTLYRNSLSEGELWDNDSYFYRYYSNIPGCLIYSDQIDLYDSLDNSNLPEYLFIENMIDEFYKIDSNTQLFIDEHRSIIDSLIQELSILYNGLNPEDTVEVDSTYQNSITNLEETLIILTNNMDSTLRDIDSMRLITIENLYSNVQNLDSYNSYDSLYKVYYYLAIKKISNDTFTELEYEFLFNLSRLCPTLYGNLTYIANSMLLEDDHLESLSENCPEPILSSENNYNNSKVICDISLFPNPAMANIDIILNSKCAMNTCKIFDVYGQELLFVEFEKFYPSNSTKLKITELDLCPGVYLIVINLDNGSLIQRKIFIN